MWRKGRPFKVTFHGSLPTLNFTWCVVVYYDIWNDKFRHTSCQLLSSTLILLLPSISLWTANCLKITHIGLQTSKRLYNDNSTYQRKSHRRMHNISEENKCTVEHSIWHKGRRWRAPYYIEQGDSRTSCQQWVQISLARLYSIFTARISTTKIGNCRIQDEDRDLARIRTLQR